MIPGLWQLIEEGEELVVFLLRNGIELVIMTACASDREPHDSAFRSHVVVTVEPRSNTLIERGIRKEITRQLFC